MIKLHSDKGFTLVELLLAMAFFSFILLFVTTGFIMINRAYNKGLTVKLVQDDGRRLMEDITRDIRTASAQSIDTSKPDCVVIGGYRYYWSIPIDGSDANSPKMMLKEEGKDCSSVPASISPGSVTVLDDRIGVQFIEIKPVSGSTGTVYSVKVVLSTAETDLVSATGEGAECSTGSGGQYCDVVTMSTVVSTR